MDKRFAELVNWLNSRNERERIVILATGCAIFAMFWYLFLEKPLSLQRELLHQATLNTQKQKLVLDREAANILIHSTQAKQQLKSNAVMNEKIKTMRLSFASPEGNNELLKAILTPPKTVKITDLRSIITAPQMVSKDKVAPTTPNAKPAIAPTKDGFQIIFQSDYANTIAYLSALEKLPWCLSWDSLEYSVSTYPAAKVLVALHIMSA